MISRNLMMVHFYPYHGWGQWVQGSPKVTKLVQGAQRGNFCGRLRVTLGTVFCVNSENTASFTW